MRRILFGAAVALCVVTAWNEPRHGVGYELHSAVGDAPAVLPGEVRTAVHQLVHIYDNFNEAGKALSH